MICIFINTLKPIVSNIYSHFFLLKQFSYLPGLFEALFINCFEMDNIFEIVKPSIKNSEQRIVRELKVSWNCISCSFLISSLGCFSSASDQNSNHEHNIYSTSLHTISGSSHNIVVVIYFNETFMGISLLEVYSWFLDILIISLFLNYLLTWLYYLRLSLQSFLH